MIWRWGRKKHVPRVSGPSGQALSGGEGKRHSFVSFIPEEKKTTWPRKGQDGEWGPEHGASRLPKHKKDPAMLKDAALGGSVRKKRERTGPPFEKNQNGGNKKCEFQAWGDRQEISSYSRVRVGGQHK